MIAAPLRNPSRVNAAPARPRSRVDHEAVLADIRAWQREGNRAARDRAFASVQRAIYKWAAHYPSPYLEREDMEQNLSLVVLDCLERFNPDAGVRFITYVTRALVQRGIRYRREARLIHVPEGVAVAIQRRDQGYTVHTDPKTGEATTSIVVGGKPLSVTDLAKLPDRLPDCLSLDEPGPGSGTADHQVIAIWNQAKSRDFGDAAILRTILHPALAALTERERIAVQRVHFEQATLSEVGRELNLTRQRVQQILAEAYRKMRPLLVNPVDTTDATDAAADRSKTMPSRTRLR